MKILFVAPQANLDTQTELLRAAQQQTATFCDGLVDRQKLEAYLQTPYEVIHFAGHGDLSILQLSDGALEVAELLGMLQAQTTLRFVVITACNSTRVGTEIHNANHVPVVLMQTAIGDAAAVRFSETFYRAYRAVPDLARAVDAGRAVLTKLYPAFADVVTFVNGDMATTTDLTTHMAYVRSEIQEMRTMIVGIETNMAKLQASQPQQAMTIALLVLLLLAQLATPWLNAAIGR